LIWTYYIKNKETPNQQQGKREEGSCPAIQIQPSWLLAFRSDDPDRDRASHPSSIRINRRS
jgi:hypothetical protein